MKSTAAEIKAVLAYYRNLSAELNKRLLGVYIDAITKAEFTDELIREETSEEDWKEEQMNAAGYLVDANMDDLGMFKPTEPLDRFDRLAAALSLHGTLCGNLLPESRAETAAAYSDTLNAALKEMGREEVKESISVPEEFRVIAWHILAINGLVLPDDMTKHTMSFWKDDGICDHSKIQARVTRPEDLEFAWKVPR